MGVRETENEKEFEDDEAEETLSFCDFVINSEGQEDDYFSKEEKSASSGRDSFEFFREDFTASSPYPRENIIFCGKLIPHGDPEVRAKPQNYTEKGCNSKLRGEETSADKFDFSVTQASVLATRAKSRWYLFASGVGRFPMEMDLRDMKIRQSRRHRVITPQSDSGGEMMESNRRTGKMLWGRLLSLVGCKTQNANSVVKASFGCIPNL